jgi:nicotinate-nucleotide adenylyltransferase
VPPLNATSAPLRIGLLGGSFNPAHEGHLHVSGQALDRLALDQVWWLVSPQNPLKDAAGMAPLDERLRTATQLAGKGRIQVTDLERELGTRYTVDTLKALNRRYPGYKFVWLMGADNLSQISRWRDWQGIFQRVPIAVFARPTYSLRALAGPAARRFGTFRIRESHAGTLAGLRPPAWVFLHVRTHAASATQLRARMKGPTNEKPCK